MLLVSNVTHHVGSHKLATNKQHIMMLIYYIISKYTAIEDIILLACTKKYPIMRIITTQYANDSLIKYNTIFILLIVERERERERGNDG